VAVAVVGAAIAGFGVFLFVGPFPGFELGFNDRHHLDEIPIDRAKACGSVESIHAALATLETSYIAATFGLTSEQYAAILENLPSTTAPLSTITQPPWPAVAADLDASAAQLDLIVAAGIPNFPPRAQRELRAIRTNIAAGRAVLPKVTNAGALNLTRTAFDRGRLHAGYASDLVGDQCAVPLGA
jgi:hypothetical protein